MFNKKTVRDVDVRGKRVLVRVDFNVPLSDRPNGGKEVADDTRIRAALPTVQFLLQQGAAVILMSHLGRPKGEVKKEFSLRPVADYLSRILETQIDFCDDCVGSEADLSANSLQPGNVLLLENTRFHPGETKNDPWMAKQLATLADIYVNDAFGSAHRAHASTEGVAHHLPAVAGFLMEKEIQYLGQVITDPERPFIAILGGAKISDKIGVIRHLLDKADRVLIGGGMANTLFFAQGYPIGDSLFEEEVLEVAREIIAESGDNLRLPFDVVIADAFSNDAEAKTMGMGPVPNGWRILDIGSETIKSYKKVILEAETIVWNGPMGVFEFPNFAKGTFEIAQAVAESKAISIIGGGDSVAAIQHAGLADKIDHLSTGGGASLEMLEGKELPGLVALQDKD
ncbi:MAG: phosphoglycerate kinase [Anaerolineales bacterium]|nr:phosphoglycerate kinase [Anaerolineales bacterium]